MIIFVATVIIFSHYLPFISSETASFYGASYVSVPLQDAKSTTEVQLRFRTKQSDALLFLAAGRTDYCLIRIESGRLKVLINLGAGESEVSSPKGLRLNDLAWHNVLISRIDANMTLYVDQIHVTREKLPARFFELNIHYGLYVGGQGEFSELFLGHGEWLRGCLSDVLYNGVDALQRARHRILNADAQSVTWNCAAEFDASDDKEISFVEDGAYMALPNIIPRTGAKWQFEMKTVTDHGVVFYTSGMSSGRSDFVGVELVNGKLRIALNKGNGAVELNSAVTVSDGDWHTISVQFTATFIEISVDGQRASMKHAQGGSKNKFFDLAETIHIGGIELNKRARALSQGLKAADTSYKGCIRRIDVDGRRLGISHARVTQGILPECVWMYPCIQQPCAPDATCVQQGVDDFRCECQRAHCVKDDFATSYKVFSKSSLLELVELSPLHVSEGENALITPSHMNVILDYAKYGVRDSGVLFSTVGSPQHGRLAVEVWERGGGNPSQQVFTLLDLAKDKVRYLHDGSESLQDSITLELELAPGAGFVLPGYLQGTHRFILHVDITPINDSPVLVIPASKVLRLAQGTRKKLSRDLVNATDPDNSPDMLVYSVLGGNSGEGGGHVERNNIIGEAITTFTQAEVDEGVIVYAHTAKIGNTKLTLQVSDGIETSAAAFLRISVYPLVLRLENNTGAFLTYNSWVRITPANLSFTTNADDPTLQIQYQIVTAPQYGWIQRQRTVEDGEEAWQAVEHFTSQQVAMGQVRYVHTQESPSQDMFKFQVSVREVLSSTIYDFRLTFIEIHLLKVKHETLLLDCVSEAVITDKHLLYTTTPLSVDLANLSYEVVGVPRYGTVSVENIVLHVGDTFTQVDIIQGRVKYKLNRTAYSTVRDGITFRVSAPQCQALAPSTLLFVHSPPSQLTEKVKLTNNKLQVVEGGSQLITRSNLDVSVTGVSSMEYELIRGPSNGWIDVLNPDNSIARNNVTLFTADELGQQRVRYTHDNSETQSDSFQFVAVSTREEDFLLVGEFEILVNLTNDNPPLRSVDRVFRVVKNGERLLTGHNLEYVDADVDCTPSDIIYTTSSISNSGIYSALYPTTPLFQFTQDDLNNNRVLYRHEGIETETRLDLWVSDGVHHAEGKLEVTASPPYVEIINNTRLVVRQGGAAHITTVNLYADTNVNLAQQQIKFEVMNGPSQGLIELKGEVDPVKLFTQEDVVEKRLSYRHNGDVTSVQDHFELRIFVDGASTRAEFNVRVFPAGYWDPLIVTNNQTFHVEESTSVSLTNKYLQVKQPHVPASDITFLIVEPPRYGYLEMEQPSAVPDDVKEETITAFDQATIDSGKLHYVQATANQTKDRMLVDVTNGITWLRGLIVSFLVVPERLYIGGGELRCEEGGNVTLTGSLLPPLTEYYIGRLTEYKLQKAPLYGHFISTSQPSRPLNKWSPQQMQAGIIQYIHNGNESTEDEFVMVAKAGEKESLPAKVRIGIVSVNDELPVIINNTGLTLWQGGSYVLTSSHLAAVDKDTPSDNLTFAIVSATAGHVALVSSPDIAIDKFTQSQINKQQLLFVHSGEKVDGEFDVVISDGINSAGPVIFHSHYKEPLLRIVGNTGLHVFPQLRKAFTSKILLAVCSDPTRDITYTVTLPPAKGVIILDPSVVPVTNFTQTDINSSRVWYQHTTPLLSDMYDNDTFTFDISSPFAEPIKNQELHIDISVWSGGLDQFIDLSYHLTVDEGATAPLRLNTSLILKFLKQHIASPIVQMKVWNLPEHGSICVKTDCNSTEFTDIQVDAGDVYYVHDHSDTTEDQIILSLYLIPGDVLLCNVTVRVRVNPINDQPFKLISQSPHASVVQGQKRTITKLDLQTEDEDTPPEEIVYDIISGPNQGALSVAGNTTVGRFTQADIDTGRVKYEHFGPLQPASFYFRVWDGQFSPAYTVFNIEVIPATLNVTVGPPVLLQQGSSVAVITAGVFVINTNGREENVKYNVTTPPHNGVIYLDEGPVMVFRQSDLITRRVMYLQKDMTKHSDIFELSASLPLEGSPIVNGLLVNVSVEPLLKFGKFMPLAGMKTKLTTDAIDAGPLAKLTSSDPIFRILRKPKHGKIKKIIRTSGERRNMREKEVSRFSHEEIRSGVIYYVAKKGSETLKDSFPFLLSGSIFQPAIGEMRFDVIGEAGYPATTLSPPKPPRLPGPKPPIGYEGVEIASPNMSDDYLLVVSMVAGTIVLAIIVVILVRCGSKRAENNGDGIKSNLNAPLPLPRPPDDLMPSSPHPKRSGPPLTPGSIPQCKVIPLGPTVDSVTGSEPELNLRYPYGAADEDWSSYEASEIGYPQRANNPMLRRNQYWV